MEKITNYLQQLDLSESEAQIYLSLLKTGPISVRELAQTIGIKRTSAYMYIDRLLEKGLITKLVIKSHTKITANDPKETLKSLVEQKVQDDKVMQENLPDVIKSITESITKNAPSEEADIKHYRGKLGVKKIYEEILKSNELRSYADMSKIAEIFPENVKLFDDVFKNNKKMKMYEICEDSIQSREYIKISKKEKSHFYRILPKDMKLTSQDVLIYDGKVAIINLKDDITGIVLHNRDLFNNFKMLFDFLWKILPTR